MKNIVLIILFFLLSPNILFRLPGNKYISALLHGALFAMVWYISNPVLEGNSNSKNANCNTIIEKYPKLTKDNEKKSLQKQIERLKCTLPNTFKY
jgi:hypothetical protein